MSLIKWVFDDCDKALPTPSYHVVFDYFREWLNWTIRNEFLFDGLRGIPQKLRRMKGKLIWQFSQLCCMGTLFQDEVDYVNKYYNSREGLPCHIATNEVVEIATVIISFCFNNKHLFTKKENNDIVSLY